VTEAAAPTDDEVAAYENDGAVVLRGLFGDRWIESLRAGLDRNLADPCPWACDYTPAAGPGGFRDDYCNWERIEEYRSFVMTSPVGGVVARLMRSSSVRFFHEHVLVKEPGTREPTPYHHDQPYYPVDGDQVCSVWLPLDPVPRAACPRFVAGSHRWSGYLTPRTFVDRRPYAGSESFAPVPDVDAALATDPEAHVLLSWDLEIGDCVAFHMKTVHGAPGTEGLATRRRAFSTRWLGDDAVWAERPYPTSPPFPGVDLEAGEPPDHPRFPLVVTG
jgi:ectoine hydroxylase-related dioxygenase (phytanoyl-CoA dioxygenase family)